MTSLIVTIATMHVSQTELFSVELLTLVALNLILDFKFSGADFLQSNFALFGNFLKLLYLVIAI